MAEQENFEQHHARYINGRLFTELGEVFLNSFYQQQQSKTSFFEKVTLPAANLAVAIRGSTTTYSFDLPGNFNEALQVAYKSHRKDVKMVDLKTTKHLKPNSMIVDDGDGKIGEAIIVSEPALLRSENDGIQTMLLPQTVLTNLFHPLGKRKRV